MQKGAVFTVTFASLVSRVPGETKLILELHCQHEIAIADPECLVVTMDIRPLGRQPQDTKLGYVKLHYLELHPAVPGGCTEGKSALMEDPRGTWVNEVIT